MFLRGLALILWGGIFPCFLFAEAKLYVDLDSKVKQALRVHYELKEIQLQTHLDQKSFGRVKVDLLVDNLNRYKMYKDSVKIHASESWGAKFLSLPESIGFLDPVTKKIRQGYKGQVVFSVLLELGSDFAKKIEWGQTKIPLVFEFQSCSDKLCLLPVELSVPILLESAELKKLDVTEKGFVSSLSQKAFQVFDSADSFSDLSLWKLFLILFFAGLLTALTPCVYPLYPLSIALFSRWTQENVKRSFLLCCTYCLGIIFSYSCLGVLSAASGAVFGSLTQTPFFYLGLGSVFLLSAVFFSGWIEFPMPQFIKNLWAKAEGKDDKKQTKGALFVKAFFMGTGLGVVAAPCVGPVLLALLLWVSKILAGSGAASYAGAFSLFAFFGLGMSIPFLILGHFILRLNKSPSWGRWTPWVKNLGSVLLVASALFFLSTGWNLLRSTQQSHESSYSFPVYEWAQRKQEDKWALYDFRADWCASCLKFERETLTDARVAAYFDRFVYVQIDMTQKTEEATQAAREMNVVSLPSIFLVNPEGKLCSALYEFEGPELFEKRLLSALKSCE